MTSHHNFVRSSYNHPGDYTPRTDALPLIGPGDTDVVRYNLLETGAPAHTRKYMNGLDVIGWTNSEGVERSHLVIDQKAGSLILPWEASNEGGIWLFLQEQLRAPHSKDERTVKELIAQGAFDALGVWSLEAPAGGIKHVDGEPIESPREAAVRELCEEQGLKLEENDLLDLLEGGLQIGGDVNTKRTYLFAGDLRNAAYDPALKKVEADETIGNNLLAFRIKRASDLTAMRALTRYCAGTNNAVTAIALQPEINRHL